MMVVRIEVWPGGDGSRAKEIGRIEIRNVSGLADVSDYDVKTSGEGIDLWTRGKVRSHVRADGWLALLRKAVFR